MKIIKIFLIILVIFLILCQIPSTQHYVRDSRISYLWGTLTKYAWTGNTMANGEYPYIGAVAVSDYNIPLGTKVVIKDKEYIVKDHTARWIGKKHGLTVDIYSTESVDKMLAFGRQPIKLKFIEE